jgi:hypothetical protein
MFFLEIRKTSALGTVQSLGLLQVFVAAKILATSPDNQGVPLPYGIIPRPDITGLTGGGSTELDGIDDLNSPGRLPTGYTILLSYNRLPQMFQIYDGTDATDISAVPVVVRVKNYGADDQRVWVQLM